MARPIGIVAGNKMRHAARRVIRHGAAKLLLGDLFVRDVLITSGPVTNMYEVSRHQHKIGDAGEYRHRAGPHDLR